MRVESVSLPLRFILLGFASLVTGVAIIAARPEVLSTYHYNQWAIAVTHLFTLGWITPVIMGAMYQLVPVALETKLYSARCARWQFWIHLAGASGLIAAFWISSNRDAGYMAAIVAASIVLFIYNMARTLRTVPRWNGIALGIASALAWLAFTLAAGGFLLLSKMAAYTPFDPVAQMHAHAHIGAVGFFVMMLVAVSYKLLPMFTLADIRSERRVRASIWLINGGLCATVVGIVLQGRWRPVAALVIVAGFVVYAVEVRAILRHRQRKTIELPVRQFLAGLALLAPVSLVGLVLSWPGLPATAFSTQLENVYGLLALLGVLTICILAMLCKIVPFLVWYFSYSRHIGRCKVPALAALSSGRLQVVSFGLFVPGLLLLAAGAALAASPAVVAGAVLVLAGIGTFLANVCLMLAHLRWPRLEPLQVKSPLSFSTPPVTSP